MIRIALKANHEIKNQIELIIQREEEVEEELIKEEVMSIMRKEMGRNSK